MFKDASQYRGKVMNINVDGNDVHFNDWYHGGLIYDDTDEEFLLGIINEETGNPVIAKPKEGTICKNSFKKDSKGQFVYENDVLSTPGGGDKNLFLMVDDGGLLGVAPLNMVRHNEHLGSSLLINSDLAQDIISKSKVISNTIDEPEWLKIPTDVPTT